MKVQPWINIQYKGTDLCMDMTCECGAHYHFDGYHAYAVECPACGAVYEIQTELVRMSDGKYPPVMLGKVE